MKTFKQFLEQKDDYKIDHESPDPDMGAPMHDVTHKGIYPSDFYDHTGFKYYSDTGNHYDHSTHSRVTAKKGNPDARVNIYRAIPMSVYKEAHKLAKKSGLSPLNHMIRPGDWVTPTKEYAHEHGMAELGGKGKYKVVGRGVKAKELYTDGNSIHEWGYHPHKEESENDGK